MTVKSFRVTMTDEETQVFQQIKKRLGLRADAEVIRYLINYYYQREFTEKKEDLNPFSQPHSLRRPYC